MSAVIRRYARAFADVMQDKQLDRQTTGRELAAFAEMIESSHDLRTIWRNPSVPGAQKRKVLDRLVAILGASWMVRNFIAVLIDRHRISALPEILRELKRELNRRMGLTEAEVTTARPLNDVEKRALVTRMEKLTGKRVLAHYGIETSLLGGAVIKAGSTVYDGSLRGQLERLKEAISA